MRLSVAMCTYNGAGFLPVQLQSLLRQGRRLDQIVICDDCSSDGTSELLHAFVLEAGHVGVYVELHFNQVNLGYVKNFEKALRLCDGDVVFLCDQDDVWREDRVEMFEREFRANPTLMLLHSDARLITADGCDMGLSLMHELRVLPAELALEQSSQPLDAFLLRNLITGATCAMRRVVIDQGLPVGDGWVHDEWLGVVAGILGKVGFLDECTIEYRQHGGNQIGSSRKRVWQHGCDVARLSSERRSVAGKRLRSLARLLDDREVRFAPSLTGLPALAWRVMFARVRLYRLDGVGWSWIADDFPRLLVRVASVSFAGGGLASLFAAGKGAWAGWRYRSAEV